MKEFTLIKTCSKNQIGSEPAHSFSGPALDGEFKYYLNIVRENKVVAQAFVSQFLKIYAYATYILPEGSERFEEVSPIIQRLKREHIVSIHKVPAKITKSRFIICLRRPHRKDITYCLLKGFNFKKIFFLIRSKSFTWFFTSVSRLFSRRAKHKLGSAPVSLKDIPAPPDEIITSPQVMVLIDRSCEEEYARYASGIKGLLHHFGFCYKEIDKDTWQGGAFDISPQIKLVLIAQASLINKIPEKNISRIISYVEKGGGLFNIDHDINLTRGDLSALLGIRSVGRAIMMKEFRLNPIEGILKLPGEDDYKIDSAVAAYPFHVADSRDSLTVISDNKMTIVSVQKLGNGNICNFFLSADVWDERLSLALPIMTHLLKELIIYCAAKPIVLKHCPPYYFIKLDDVTLKSSIPQIKAFLNKKIPVSLGLFLYDTSHENINTLKNIMLQNERLVSLSPHSGGWKHSFWFDVLNKKPLSRERQLEHINEIRQFFSFYGLPMSKVLNPHFYEMGSDAVISLKETGFKYTMMSFKPTKLQGKIGLEKKGKGAMGNISYFYGYIGEELHNFCAEDYNHLRYLPENLWDWLRGCTSQNGQGITYNAVQRGFLTLLKAYYRGFPAVLSTHEYRLTRFTPDQIEDILQQIEDKISGYGFKPIRASDETVSAAIKDLEDTYISSVSDSAGTIDISLKGRCDTPFELFVYTTKNARPKMVRIEPFNGDFTVKVENVI